MREDTIYHFKDRITVQFDRELNATHCKYFKTYDEAGVYLQGAVRSGLEFATDHGVPNWIVDVSQEVDSMSEKDRDWEGSEEFYKLFQDSAVEKIVLVVAPPDVGGNLDGELEWAAESEIKFGGGIAFGVACDEAGIRKFLKD